MIHDVDETLRALIRHDVLAGSEADVVFEAPTKDWSSRRNAPTLDVYLYDIREDLRRREHGVIDVHDTDGRTTGRRRPPRHYKLSYLVTAWTQRPEDEHRLLSAVLGCFIQHDRLPDEFLAGQLVDLGMPVPITVALPPPEDRALSDVWSALGGELKPSLDLVVTLPLDTLVFQPAAVLVQEQTRITVVSDGGAVDQAVGKKRGRDSKPAAADREGAGFGSHRAGRGGERGRGAGPRPGGGSGGGARPVKARRATANLGQTASTRPSRPAPMPSRVGSSAGGTGPSGTASAGQRATLVRRSPFGPTVPSAAGVGAANRSARSGSRCARSAAQPDPPPGRRAGHNGGGARQPARSSSQASAPRRPGRTLVAGPARMMISDVSVSRRHLLGCLDALESRVRALVEHRRQSDADPDDRFRGLYISDDRFDRLLNDDPARRSRAAPDPSIGEFVAALETKADEYESGGGRLRLRHLRRAFGLDQLDLDLLLVAMAPDLDRRFEQIYGYLNDDVTRRRASVGLALELCRADLMDGTARSRFGPTSPMLAGHLAELEDTDRPFLSRALRVPDRVTAYVLGDDTPDGILRPLLMTPVDVDVGYSDDVGRAIASGTELIYTRESTGSAAFAFLTRSLAAAELPVVAIDLSLLDPGSDVVELGAVAAREAKLQGGVLVAAHMEVVAERGASAARALVDAGGVVALTGTSSWDPRWSRRPPLLFDAPAQDDGQRQAAWLAVLGGDAIDEPTWRGIAAYRLTPEQVFGAARSARQQAAAAGRGVEMGDLQTGARAQNAAGLERLARRVPPRAGWSDLVLPDAVEGLLRDTVARVRQRSRVLDDWGMGDATSRGRGVTVLFSGDSGTGKTLSAEVVARSLGLDLYVIDLSTVVDKYIGETEKNLDRIFAEAERVNGVLLFDEADAIFGKRSEVRDARDRYANVEVAYLLQRMEQFQGIAILTTNLRANVDEAFLRRLDVLVEFPMPDRDSRRRLWLQQFRPGVPREPDIDFDFLAAAFELSGGNIRNIVLAGAYLAADNGRAVSMADLIRATAGEYRKLGRLCVEAEFGRYHQFHLGRLGGEKRGSAVGEPVTGSGSDRRLTCARTTRSQESRPGPERPPARTWKPASPVPQHWWPAASADPSAVLELQRTAGNAAVVQLLSEDDGAEGGGSPVLDVVGRGGGQPLPSSTRSAMEGAMGADFGDVRVHTDSAAAAVGAGGPGPRLHGGQRRGLPVGSLSTRHRLRSAHARPRADPCGPAAQRPGVGHADRRRCLGQPSL